MISDITVFGYMTQKAANEELKMNLSIVKQQAETLLHEMDLLIDRCRFEPGEGQKWDDLRDSLLQFRTVEVSTWKVPEDLEN